MSPVFSCMKVPRRPGGTGRSGKGYPKDQRIKFERTGEVRYQGSKVRVHNRPNE